MKLLENTKLTGAALILLLGLNSALLVVLIARKPPVPPPPPMQPMMPPPPAHAGARDFLINQVGMDSLQQAKYDTLIQVHKPKLERLMTDIQGNRDSIVRALASDSPDSAKVNMWSDRIGNDQSRIEQLNFYHFRDVRGVCTPDQRPKFDSAIRGALRLMGPPNGGPGPGRMGPPPMGPPPMGPAR